MVKNKKIKLIIAGSRDLGDYNLIDRAIAYANIDIKNVSEIYHGASPGIEKLSGKWAENHKIKVKEFRPDWSNIKHEDALIRENKFGKYDAKAAFRRNKLLAEEGDVLLAITCNKDTDDIIECVKKLGKPVHVYEADTDNDEDQGEKSEGSMDAKTFLEQSNIELGDDIPF